MRSTFFITGTDTGVGKTVFTALFARYLWEAGVSVAALKPLCSGGRADARVLRVALGGSLALDEINPWHFRAAIAPSLAASREGRVVWLAEVRAHICAVQRKFAVTLVEGAGGLLSPLGHDFDSRDLLIALRATPIIVAANKLGVVNHLRLTLEALPKPLRQRASVVLMAPAKPDTATASNPGLLGQFMITERIFQLPWLGAAFDATAPVKKAAVTQILQKLTVGQTR